MKTYIFKTFLVLSSIIASQLNLWAATTMPTKHVGRTSDSLLQMLRNEKDEMKKIAIYRNLADLNYNTKNEAEYLKGMYKASVKQGDSESITQALYELSAYYIDKDSIPKAEEYKNLIGKYTSANQFDQLDTYLSIRLFTKSLLDNEGADAIQKKLNQYNKETYSKHNEGTYKLIEQAYVIAVAMYEKKDSSAITYAIEAAQLADKLPLKSGIDYIILTKRLLARIYAYERNANKSVEYIEQVIKAKEEYVQKHCQNRPFYPMISFYVSNYTTAMINARIIPEEQAKKYLKIIIELSDISNNPEDKYNRFLSMNNYYISRKGDAKNKPLKENLEKGLVAIDSLIKYARIIAPYNLAGLHYTSSLIHAGLNDYEKAYNTLQISNDIKDSLSNKDFKDKLNLLQTEYDVNKLNYEKSQLEVRNKRITIIALIVVLLLAATISVYLYSNLKKERFLKTHLAKLNARAEQSEKMKIEFINSICHEIRTPLNAISGFSELITDPTFDIDKETQKQFSAEIRTNTNLLTDLIDVIIEVANLDVSDELLEREQTDIALICNNNITRYLARGRGEIEYRTDMVPESIIVPTHARYFGMVIENLLSNANKFTQAGSITIGCRIIDSKLVVSVTDTGCGIPEDMHEHIFERFTKLDIYAQGSGLGLYLCRLVVKRLAGKIYIDPTYKTGTRIVVELPIE